VSGSAVGGATLSLLGSFQLMVGERSIAVGGAGARILAMLGLQGRQVSRQRLADKVWPAQAGERARANLRGVIWRMTDASRNVVVEDQGFLALRAGLRVDVDDMIGDCAAILGGVADAGTAGARLAVGAFADELLSGWDDEWVLVERERLRHLRLHALERHAAALLEKGLAGEAAQISAAAWAGEPLRESAVRLLVRAHLDSGNRAEARRVLERFRTVLAGELGIEPSPELAGLLDPGGPAGGLGASMTVTPR
jgi:DNA-binding SARP family transcriptional activator